MFSFLRYGVIAAILAFPAAAHSQDDVNDTVVKIEELRSDTLFSDEESYPEYDKSIFSTAGDNSPVAERTIDPSAVEKLRKDDAYWYANTEFPKKKPKDTKREKGFWESSTFKTIFWILLIGVFVTLLIWFLASSNVRLFQRRRRIVLSEGEAPVQTENIFELDFEEEARKALVAGDYRQAIRIYFLQSLRVLADKDLIDYSPEKTNSDYLMQLAGGPHYRGFFRIARNFEFVWYGGLQPSREQFTSVQHDFSTFKQQVGA